LALLGGFTFLGMGLINYVVPQFVRRPIYSRALSEWQYWLLLIGFLLFFWVLTQASFLQGQSWAQGVPEVNVLTLIRPHYIGRAVAGVLILASTIVFAWNIFATLAVDTGERARREFKTAARPALSED
jgi:cbb3-type cytochrome oxidase subunit 1